VTHSSVLAIPDFRQLWLGQAVSQLGDAIYFLIFMFMVDRITGNPAMVGYVGAIQSLPYLLLGPYAGVIADRVDRRRVMLFADITSAILLGGLAAWLIVDPTPPIALVFVTAGSLSLVNVFFAPAKSAAIPRLVPTDRLMEANALSAATQNAMPILGLAFSGTVLGLLFQVAEDWFFFAAVTANALTFLVSAGYIARLPRIRPDRPDGPPQAWADTRDGFRYVRRHPILLSVLASSALMNLAISPFFVVYVVINRQWFDGQYSTLAAIDLAFFVGMVATSLYIGRHPVHRTGIAYLLGLGGSGLCIVAMAFSPHFWPFLLWNLLCGFILPYAQVPLSTYLQLSVPDAFRGRVNAAVSMVSHGVVPVGAALAGMVLQRIGPVSMLLMIGAGFALSGVVAYANPRFRRARADDPPIAG